MTALKKIPQSRDITADTEVRLLKVFVRPVANHGCESWTTNKTDYSHTEAFEMKELQQRQCTAYNICVVFELVSHVEML